MVLLLVVTGSAKTVVLKVVRDKKRATKMAPKDENICLTFTDTLIGNSYLINYSILSDKSQDI